MVWVERDLQDHLVPPPPPLPKLLVVLASPLYDNKA